VTVAFSAPIPDEGWITAAAMQTVAGWGGERRAAGGGTHESDGTPDERRAVRSTNDWFASVHDAR